jgi:hypothetical protein
MVVSFHIRHFTNFDFALFYECWQLCNYVHAV